jgi:hypothetical protein
MVNLQYHFYVINFYDYFVNTVKVEKFDFEEV